MPESIEQCITFVNTYSIKENTEAKLKQKQIFFVYLKGKRFRVKMHISVYFVLFLNTFEK